VDDVVVDEWIIVRTLELERDPADPGAETVVGDTRPSEILVAAQEKGRWIVSNDTVRIYLERVFHASYKGTIWRRVHASVLGVLADSERHVHVGDPPEVEGRYHRKDRPWVSVAAALDRDCCLLTGDINLVADLNASDIPQERQIRPMDVDAAHYWAKGT
jgi:hypothetical protein